MESSHYHSRIKELIHQIHQHQIRVKDVLADFTKWVKKSQDTGKYRGNQIKPLGLSRNSIYSWRVKLTALKSKINSGAIQENEIEEELETIENFVQVFSKAVQGYFTEYAETIDPFEGKTWYIYFFHIDEDAGGEPTLGRVVLKTFSKNHVELTNFGHGTHVHYEKGQYSLIYNYACFLELETRHGDRKLHIKVRYISSDYEIFIGSYITYENEHVVRGTLIMEPAQGESIKPLVLSSFKNKEIFYAVDPAIRQFLSLRKYNYQKITNRIFNLEGLREFLYEKRGEDWPTRFFEENKPILFIAYPGLSIDPESYGTNVHAIERIVQQLNHRFKGKLDIRYGNNRQQEREISFSEEVESLKRTRLFALIYTKAELGSYSLVQLGLAMAYCKVVMMFYELGSISGHLETLHRKVHKYPLENGLESESTCKVIYKAIEAKIEESCEKWLK